MDPPAPPGQCPDEDAIDEYVLHRLPPEQIGPVEAHLLRCVRCAQAVEATRAIVQALRDAAPLLTPDAARKRLRTARQKRPRRRDS